MPGVKNYQLALGKPAKIAYLFGFLERASVVSICFEGIDENALRNRNSGMLKRARKRKIW